MRFGLRFVSVPNQHHGRPSHPSPVSACTMASDCRRTRADNLTPCSPLLETDLRQTRQFHHSPRNGSKWIRSPWPTHPSAQKGEARQSTQTHTYVAMGVLVEVQKARRMHRKLPCIWRLESDRGRDRMVRTETVQQCLSDWKCVLHIGWALHPYKPETRCEGLPMAAGAEHVLMCATEAQCTVAKTGLDTSAHNCICTGAYLGQTMKCTTIFPFKTVNRKEKPGLRL